MFRNLGVSRTNCASHFRYTPQTKDLGTHDDSVIQKVDAPTPPYFAMYMQINDLQRSVGDRYANKGLTGSSRVSRMEGKAKICR
jgi:hypothetical protein